MSQRPRILVVGAGPTGLTAAVELARRGYRPRIVDRNDGPTPLSKAVGISARSLELLEPSGANGRLLAEGLRIPQIGRAHVCTPVTHAHLVCRLLLEKNNERAGTRL